jgi:hypothetical protein
VDELTLLDRALPAAGGPAPDAVAAGRHALLHEIRRPAPAPRSRPTRRLVITGAAAAALAVGVTVAQNVGGDGSGPGVLPGAAVANAAQLGSAAATVAEREPWRAPRPDQWIYSLTRNADGLDMNRSWEGVDPAITNRVPAWRRVDGRGIAYLSASGELRTMIDGENGVQISRPEAWMPTLRDYETFPTEPSALLAKLRSTWPDEAEGEVSDDWVFSQIDGMLSGPLPPRLRGALFRVLPRLHGVVLRRGVRDQIGRPGVAFELTGGNERTQVILDTASLRYLGSRIVVVRDHRRTGDAGVTKAGTTVQSTAVVAVRIVDHPGDTR